MKPALDTRRRVEPRIPLAPADRTERREVDAQVVLERSLPRGERDEARRRDGVQVGGCHRVRVTYGAFS